MATADRLGSSALWKPMAILAVSLGAIAACAGSDGSDVGAPDFAGVERSDEVTDASDSQTPAADPNAFDLTNVPDEQRAALEDGVLTPEEYRRAFESFRDCSAEAGVEISGGSEDPDTGQIRYTYPAERPGYEQGDDPLVIAVEECFVTYFRSTDAIFQTTDPEMLQQRREDQVEFYETTVKPCLDQNGVEHPELLPLESEDQEAHVAVMKPFFELLESGRCE